MAEFLLIVDTETTGLDPATDRIIELGFALYHTGLGLISCGSVLVQSEGAAEGVHGIDPAALEHGIPRGAVGAALRRAAAGHDVTLVAYNADFDRGFLPPDSGPWLCACNDAEWPVVTTSKSLVQVALALGVGVSRAHRAIDDVLTLCAMLDRVRERDPGLVEWLRIAREPRVEVIGRQAFERNEDAKAAGFRWEPKRRVWVAQVRASVVDEWAKGLPFRIEMKKQAA